MTNVYGNADYTQVQTELHAELKRLRAELKVPEQDAPESLMRPGQGAGKGKAKEKGKGNGKAKAKAAE
jgi:hypothetical protein